MHTLRFYFLFVFFLLSFGMDNVYWGVVFFKEVQYQYVFFFFQCSIITFLFLYVLYVCL